MNLEKLGIKNVSNVCFFSICYRSLIKKIVKVFKGAKRLKMKWWIIAGILCLFGVSKEFRPMEPYLYNYQHENLNISDADLNGQIYPIWTYSYLIALIPSLLLTDVFLYKPVLIFESLCYISVWITLIFYKSIFSQQLGQAVYGFATATEVAYFAYIYVKVDRKKFSKFVFL